LTAPELRRQHTLIDLYLALDAFGSLDYQGATAVALSALEKSRQIHSCLNRNRIEALYRQLLNTPFRDKPQLAHLGVQLRTWAYGMN
jgi:hypothetical protein